MVRVITQETFNSVVKENMEEFEMGKEEAIKEAKDQFETQVCTLIGKYKIKLTNWKFPKSIGRLVGSSSII